MLSLEDEMVCQHDAQRKIELREDAHGLPDEKRTPVALLLKSVLNFLCAYVKGRAELTELLIDLQEACSRAHHEVN